MKLSDEGLDFVKQAEGFRSRVYLDPNGIPTIGFGHRLRPLESFPGGIAEPQASRILLSDIREAEAGVNRLVRVPLTQGQFDALLDFCFNLGQGRLAASTLLADLNAGRYAAAAEQILLWNHAGSREDTGLRLRRQAEFHLWHQPSLRQPAP